MNQSKKLLSLESLRGMSAITIVFYHFHTGSHFDSAFVKNSWLLVDFFFVLSGFVIFLNYFEKINSFSDFWAFQQNRILRIYPLHIFMLLVFLGLELAKYVAEIYFGKLANNPPFSENNLAAFLLNVGLLQNWTLSDLTFNYPSWSISAEFYTYAIFGLLAAFTTASKQLFYLAIVLLILMSGLVLTKNGMHTDSLTGPSRCIYSFFIGAMACAAYRKFSLNGKVSTSYLAVAMLLISIILMRIMGSEKTGFVVLVPAFFALTLLSVVATRNSAYVAKFLNNRFFVYLGTISYSIYMIHAAVWFVFNQVLRFVFGFATETTVDGKLLVKIPNIYLADLISLVGVLVIVLLAHFSYEFIEKRFYKKRILQSPFANSGRLNIENSGNV